MNKVILIGRVGRDPEIRTMQNGNKVANFSMATSERWKDKNTGERKEHTDWHNIAIFNPGLVGVVEKYVSKGDQIMIEGKIQTRKWQDQSGNDRYTTEVVLQSFGGSLELLSGSSRGGDRDEHPNDPAQQGPIDDLDSEIPF